jgi:hypothetical protein
MHQLLTPQVKTNDIGKSPALVAGFIGYALRSVDILFSIGPWRPRGRTLQQRHLELTEQRSRYLDSRIQ